METTAGIPASMFMAVSCLNMMITNLSGACEISSYLSPIGCRKDTLYDPMYYAWTILCCISILSMVYAMYATVGELPASSLSVLCCCCLSSGPFLFNTRPNHGK